MRVAEIAYSSSSRSIIRLTSGSVRKFVREWAAKTEQAKDAGRPRTRRYGADRGHRHATVCSRPGTQRNSRMGPDSPGVYAHHDRADVAAATLLHAEQRLRAAVPVDRVRGVGDVRGAARTVRGRLVDLVGERIREEELSGVDDVA